MAEVTEYMHVPPRGEKTSSSTSYPEKAILRNHISALEPSKSAAKLLLRMSDIARKVCMTVSKDHTSNTDGARQESRIPQE